MKKFTKLQKILNGESTQGGKRLTEMATISTFWSGGQKCYLMQWLDTLLDVIGYIFE